MKAAAFDAEAFEVLLGRVLGVGSMVSTALLALGLGVFIVLPGRGVATPIVRAGLVILLLTPVARVLVATLGYVRAREWYAAATAGAVLLVLFGSIIAAVVR